MKSANYKPPWQRWLNCVHYNIPHGGCVYGINHKLPKFFSPTPAPWFFHKKQTFSEALWPFSLIVKWRIAPKPSRRSIASWRPLAAWCGWCRFLLGFFWVKIPTGKCINYSYMIGWNSLWTKNTTCYIDWCRISCKRGVFADAKTSGVFQTVRDSNIKITPLGTITKNTPSPPSYLLSRWFFRPLNGEEKRAKILKHHRKLNRIMQIGGFTDPKTSLNWSLY